MNPTSHLLRREMAAAHSRAPGAPPIAPLATGNHGVECSGHPPSARETFRTVNEVSVTVAHRPGELDEVPRPGEPGVIPVRAARGDGLPAPLDVFSICGLRAHCGSHAGLGSPAPVLLEIDVALHVDARVTSPNGPGRRVDDGSLAAEIAFLVESCDFPHLESVVDAIARYVVVTADGAHRARAEAVMVRAARPGIRGLRTTASLEIRRVASDYPVRSTPRPFGSVDTIYEDGNVGVHRLWIKPGGSLVTGEAPSSHRRELVLGDGLLVEGQPVAPGTALDWPRRSQHRYDNPRPTEQPLITVEHPPAIPIGGAARAAIRAGLPQPESRLPS
jgi:hypothetical protein